MMAYNICLVSNMCSKFESKRGEVTFHRACRVHRGVGFFENPVVCWVEVRQKSEMGGRTGIESSMEKELDLPAGDKYYTGWYMTACAR